MHFYNKHSNSAIATHNNRSGFVHKSRPCGNKGTLHGAPPYNIAYYTAVVLYYSENPCSSSVHLHKKRHGPVAQSSANRHASILLRYRPCKQHQYVAAHPPDTDKVHGAAHCAHTRFHYRCDREGCRSASSLRARRPTADDIDYRSDGRRGEHRRNMHRESHWTRDMHIARPGGGRVGRRSPPRGKCNIQHRILQMPESPVNEHRMWGAGPFGGLNKKNSYSVAL